jgi:hexulose-6-phosphate isomerase
LAVLGAAAARGALGAAASRPRNAVLVTMLPKELSYTERFRLAREVGFEGVEAQAAPDPREAEAIRAASVETGLRIHSVMNMEHWRNPLSSADPLQVDRSVAGMETSLRNAKLWERILPLAAELRIVVAVEEVWNKFLLSPVEFARYVDEFESPWVRAYFDVGNVVFYGYPQDWIRTLGKRIVKLHLKDFLLDRPSGRFHWRNLGEGDIDWPEVRRALADIGYDGYTTTEIAGGDAAYLKDVVARVERFYAGQAPVPRP